jgi:hypothetical protein
MISATIFDAEYIPFTFYIAFRTTPPIKIQPRLSGSAFRVENAINRLLSGTSVKRESILQILHTVKPASE